jgi:hypothetical protein
VSARVEHVIARRVAAQPEPEQARGKRREYDGGSKRGRELAETQVRRASDEGTAPPRHYARWPQVRGMAAAGGDNYTA